MKYRCAIGVLISIIVLSVTADGGTQRHVSTNFEIFESQVGAVADSIILALETYRTEWAGSGHAMVSYKPSIFGLRDAGNIARQRIEEHLLGSKFQVVMDSSVAVSRGAGLFDLTVTVPFVDVNYSAPISSHLFRSSEVVRTIRSSYDVEIADSGEVKFARSYSLATADTIEQSAIPDLERGSYGFLFGRSDPSGLIDSVVQPLIFAASAVIIVYLFFTLRGS